MKIIKQLQASAVILITLLTFAGAYPSSPAVAQSAQSGNPEIDAVLARLPDRAKTGTLGVLTVTNFPMAILNRVEVTMAPGTRIYSTGNAILLPGSLQGSAQPVLYREDMLGQLIEAWVVTDAEITAIRRWRSLTR
jgi:hypothetical protein